MQATASLVRKFGEHSMASNRPPARPGLHLQSPCHLATLVHRCVHQAKAGAIVPPPGTSLLLVFIFRILRGEKLNQIG
ncbi:hypothetical protein SV7mr_42500 [Stieleria bergensis]|uniref:Uncharacterized protein n=1 Tax=Stieleria bergensis TaxID=2528025 RepID=A0A517T093_9BACT|nr:hypothetical protein SV7mr_42500 [Planctomycetes bacterium SV_7m_r]